VHERTDCVYAAADEVGNGAAETAAAESRAIHSHGALWDAFFGVSAAAAATAATTSIVNSSNTANKV
jgi:hypothetical protein